MSLQVSVQSDMHTSTYNYSHLTSPFQKFPIKAYLQTNFVTFQKIPSVSFVFQIILRLLCCCEHLRNSCFNCIRSHQARLPVKLTLLDFSNQICGKLLIESPQWLLSKIVSSGFVPVQQLQTRSLRVCMKYFLWLSFKKMNQVLLHHYAVYSIS